jgi:predicted RecB family nuclease
MSVAHRLSKSRFVAGLQCLKRLWWEVHEPGEDEPDPSRENRFAWGHRVNERARALLGEGVLIDRDRLSQDAALEATRKALKEGAQRVYEAAFEAEGVFVAVDAIERIAGGWRLIEVKSSTKVKAEHVADCAIQAWVLRRAGLRVLRAEVAHLNNQSVFPDLDDLILRVDVTKEVRAFLRSVPKRLREQRAVLAGALPEREIGRHCAEPWPCPFHERCWGALPAHHLRTLYIAKEPLLERLLALGATTVGDIPDDVVLNPIQARQRRAVRAADVVVEEGLAEAVASFPAPIAFLDFETVSPSIPAWDGCSPYTQVPVQFACLVRPGPRAPPVFHEHLAEEGADPRRALAERLIAATRGAKSVFAYYARFEIGCIQHLAFALPDLRKPLLDLADRMADLLPVVREHVYHPAFQGSFSLKQVLPALLPHLAYDDLEVQEGGSAAALLERMLILGTAPTGPERDRLRTNLLAYCRRDVEGLAALYDWLASRG